MSFIQVMNIGILAYGSLITDPGNEILQETKTIIKEVETPFCVEYARKSRTRENAPTLVPVPDGIGSPVVGVIFVLKENVIESDAINYLYRREIHRVSSGKTYDQKEQSEKPKELLIRSLENFYGISKVIYTCLKPNFEEILSPCLSEEEKAKWLAEAATKSITSKTYEDKTDGIWYLHQNIQAGIITPLTEPYKNEILRRANGAADLPAARDYLARQKGII